MEDRNIHRSVVALTVRRSLCTWTTTLWWMHRFRVPQGFTTFTPGYLWRTALRFHVRINDHTRYLSGSQVCLLYAPSLLE
jgi:hypothetical protein